MSLTVEETTARNKELIDEVLRVYPEKTAKQRAKHLSMQEEGKSDCSVKSNIKSMPGVMTDPRLRLRRLQGRGVGPDQGHDPYQPRPGRLRPIFLGIAP